jgi:hypothetical protein
VQVESGKFLVGNGWSTTPLKCHVFTGKPARKPGWKQIFTSHNISGQLPNRRPTNGVFGVKKPEFVVV